MGLERRRGEAGLRRVYCRRIPACRRRALPGVDGRHEPGLRRSALRGAHVLCVVQPDVRAAAVGGLRPGAHGAQWAFRLGRLPERTTNRSGRAGGHARLLAAHDHRVGIGHAAHARAPGAVPGLPIRAAGEPQRESRRRLQRIHGHADAPAGH